MYIRSRIRKLPQLGEFTTTTARQIVVRPSAELRDLQRRPMSMRREQMEGCGGSVLLVSPSAGMSDIAGNSTGQRRSLQR